MELSGKKILVAGFGRSGRAAAEFLLERGARVTMCDNNERLQVPREFTSRGMRVELGEFSIATVTAQDMIVLSPGVPLMSRALIEAQARGIPVISEIELAFRHISAPLIAVTGTNGKTTTTSLLGHLFEGAGLRVFVGGNIGIPLINAVALDPQPDYVIAEISSFQLETIDTFRPHISVLLNITDDHLDRYASFEQYRQAKAAICQNQTDKDFLIANLDDPALQPILADARATVFGFSRRTAPERGAFDDGHLRCVCPGRPSLSISTEKAGLIGSHNRENMLAAVAAAYLCDVPALAIQKAIENFRGLPHRMEPAGEINGITYINDSKGTNVGACCSSLAGVNGRLVLIAGGLDKGGSYAPLIEPLRTKARALVLIGEAAGRMQAELHAHVAIVRAASLEEAVSAATRLAHPGDSVLLSPACASFDMFDNYEHRGECFKTIVKKIQRTADSHAS
ncbi:MAG: UDP-N-acetylmuramoyl-L-alanine--D-glutamate ligase [Deltaproteobacteria bacterium]|nr:UDP-N-acetylmuramoyl-L-alanine--D-glutamate ligase [Deltaproteobacteria bacterium]